MDKDKGFLIKEESLLISTEGGTISSIENKVLIFGPVGSGKTTTVRILSDSFTMNNRYICNGSSITVDIGQVKPKHSEPLSLLASYGQDYAKLFSGCLEDDLVGIILLIDNRRKDPLNDLENFLSILLSEEYKTQLIRKIVIGVTHVDISRTPEINDFRKLLEKHNLLKAHTPPLFSVDARSRQQMFMLLQALLYSQDPFINTINTADLTSIQSE